METKEKLKRGFMMRDCETVWGLLSLIRLTNDDRRYMLSK